MNRTSLDVGTLLGILKTLETDAASAFSHSIALRDRLQADGDWDDHGQQLGDILGRIDGAIAKPGKAKQAVEQASPSEKTS